MRKKRPSVPEATREDVAALIDRFSVPPERLRVRNWPLFARALAREARRYGLPVPHWLVYPRPPTALRAVRRTSPSMSSPSSRLNAKNISDLPTGDATIIVGSGNMIGKWKAHLDAQRAKTEPTAPDSSASATDD